MLRTNAPYRLPIRYYQAAITMRIGAHLARTEFAFLAFFGTTGGASNREGLFLLRFHNWIMHFCAAMDWSILTIPRVARVIPQSSRFALACTPVWA
jgi:hypothetical protein